MSVIENQYNNIKGIDIESLLIKVINDSEEDITSINKGQMLKGEDGTGNITPLTSNGDSPDLFDTGAFQGNMFTTVDSNKVITSSKDEKTDILVEKYGAAIFVLNKPNTELAQDIVTPKFLNEFHTLINK